MVDWLIWGRLVIAQWIRMSALRLTLSGRRPRRSHSWTVNSDSDSDRGLFSSLERWLLRLMPDSAFSFVFLPTAVHQQQ